METPGEDTILVVEYPNEQEEGIPSSLSGAPSDATGWSHWGLCLELMYFDDPWCRGFLEAIIGNQRQYF